MTRSLTLALQGEYFDAIKAGEKLLEYRRCTPYWETRLARAPFDQLVLLKGYPARGDGARRLVVPWRGFSRQTITHKHFGPEPVEVFAIVVG